MEEEDCRQAVDYHFIQVKKQVAIDRKRVKLSLLKSTPELVQVQVTNGPDVGQSSIEETKIQTIYIRGMGTTTSQSS